MVTGASTADLAVILIDARKGVLTQTRRHSYLVSLLGIRHVVLAINKLDLVDYSQEVVRPDRGRLPRVRRRDRARRRRRASRCRRCAATTSPSPAPQHALVRRPDAARSPGDRSRSTTRRRTGRSGCRCSGSTVPNLDFRGFVRHDRRAARCDPATGCGCCRPAARARSRGSSPSDGDLDRGGRRRSRSPSRSTDEIDVSRGDVLASARDAAGGGRPVRGARRLDVRASRCCRAGRTCSSSAPAPCTATVAQPKYKVNVNTLEHTAATHAGAQRDRRRAPQPATGRSPFDPYADNRDMGGFILIDRLTNDTVGAGLLHFALRRAEQRPAGRPSRSTRQARAALKGHQPCVVWFTGLSGAGKSTIANLVEQRLHADGRAHLPARRRQRPARPQPRPRLHRGRPRREHPPGRPRWRG